MIKRKTLIDSVCSYNNINLKNIHLSRLTLLIFVFWYDILYHHYFRRTTKLWLFFYHKLNAKYFFSGRKRNVNKSRNFFKKWTSILIYYYIFIYCCEIINLIQQNLIGYAYCITKMHMKISFKFWNSDILTYHNAEPDKLNFRRRAEWDSSHWVIIKYQLAIKWIICTNKI